MHPLHRVEALGPEHRHLRGVEPVGTGREAPVVAWALFAPLFGSPHRGGPGPVHVELGTGRVRI